MANTYTQIYIHLVFAVKHRDALIPQPCLDELYRYMAGILVKIGQKPLAIGGMPDHIHLLYGMRPDSCPSDVARDVKSNASRFIKQKGWIKGVDFSWQEGFGGFSYSRSQIGAVIQYILNQEAHHKKSSFKEEYLKILRKFEVEFDEKYLFEFFE